MLSYNSALQCLTSHLIENARELCISKEFLLCKSSSTKFLLQNFYFTFQLWYATYLYDQHLELLWGK